MALLLAALPACGTSSGDEAAAPAGCASDAECAEGQQCIDTACVEPAPIPVPGPSASAVPFACTVIDCPSSEPCCIAATATANDNESQGYANRNQMVASAHFGFGEMVVAKFSFDAADQQGWLTFEFGSELDLDRIDVTGHQSGKADRFLTVTTNRDGDTGCAFGFELDEPRPSPLGEQPLYGKEVYFNDRDFCYGGDSHPGRARQLAFAVFAKEPGDAWLTISKVALHVE